MTRLTLADIRTKYPEPRRAGHDALPGQTGTYCVGGAFCLMLEDVIGCYYGVCYPLTFVLRDALHRAIPAVSLSRAEYYARDIIAFNDEGRFEEAWEVLGEALDWQVST